MVAHPNLGQLSSAEVAELDLLRYAFAAAFAEKNSWPANSKVDPVEKPQTVEAQPMTLIRLNDGASYQARCPYQPIPEGFYTHFNALVKGPGHGVKHGSFTGHAKFSLDEASGRFELRAKRKLIAEYIVVRNGRNEEAWAKVVERLKCLESQGLPTIASHLYTFPLNPRWAALYLHPRYWDLPERERDYVLHYSVTMSEVFFQAND